MNRIEYYRSQGAYAPPGYENFVLGHLPVFEQHNDQITKLWGTDQPAIKHPIQWTLDQLTESKAPYSFDYTKHQVQVLNLINPLVCVSDPEIVKDMFVTKNSQMDKPTDFFYALSSFAG